MRAPAAVGIAIFIALTAASCFDPKFPDGQIGCARPADCPAELPFCRAGADGGGKLWCFRADADGGAAADGAKPAITDAGGKDAISAVPDGGSNGDGGPTGGDAGDAGNDCAQCELGAKRCDQGGLETCVAMGADCTAWSAAAACQGRQVCPNGAAACQCPPPPLDCTAAGATCDGANNLVTCAVDGDQCVYQAASAACTAAEPCGGAFPNAACQCAPKPAACGGPGTYCDANGAVITCALDANHCLVQTKSVACSVPCTGTPGAAACGSCAPPPAECMASAGFVCTGGGELETCGSDPNTGCLVETDVEPCLSPRACVGNGVASSCACPTPPSFCMGQTGTVCVSGVVETCGMVNGCLAEIGSQTCSSPQTCAGNLPAAACTCPIPAACPTNKPGSYCDSSTGNLVTCQADSLNCIEASSAPCNGSTVCSGAFPNGACVCPPAPSCAVAGTSCSSATLISCAQDGQGCFHETDTNCAASGLLCATAAGTSMCSCPSPPPGCSRAGAQTCTGDTTYNACTATPQGCLQSTAGACPNGQFCWSSTSTCAVPSPIGYPTDLGSSGTFNPGAAVGEPITITATSTVRSFGMIANAPASGIYMGLYTDVGGAPSALVATSGAQSVLLAAPSKNEYPASPATAGGSLQIQPGQYWIVALYQSPTAVHVGPTGGATINYAEAAAGFGPLPQSLTGAGALTGRPIVNYYVLVTQ